ncbi:MAG: DUF998 domain-containing protein, partial [Lysobacteraceae bacterium]
MPPSPSSRWPVFAGRAALPVFAAVSLVCGALPVVRATGFAQSSHPLAWLGATGMPAAAWFNALGFGLGGLLAAIALWPLRASLPVPARWTARIGTQALWLSAPAFAAQGAWPLDPREPDGLATGLHGIAWMAWWLAFGVGGLLRATAPVPARGIAVVAAVLVPAVAVAGGLALPAALAERLAVGRWLGGLAGAAGFAG